MPSLTVKTIDKAYLYIPIELGAIIAAHCTVLAGFP